MLENTKAYAAKSIRFPSSDFIAVDALARYTGISFSGHVRAALKMYLRENKQLVKEAVQASPDGPTAA